MADPLAELRALRDAETDPARRAQLDALIARLEAQGAPSAALRLDGSQTGAVTTDDGVGRDKQEVAEQRNAEVRDEGQVGNLLQGDVGGSVNAPIVQPGASATVATTVHQHHYPALPPGGAGAAPPGT